MMTRTGAENDAGTAGSDAGVDVCGSGVQDDDIYGAVNTKEASASSSRGAFLDPALISSSSSPSSSNVSTPNQSRKTKTKKTNKTSQLKALAFLRGLKTKTAILDLKKCIHFRKVVQLILILLGAVTI